MAGSSPALTKEGHGNAPDERAVGIFGDSRFPMKLRLPSHAHTPGEGTEPDLVPLDEAKALIPARFAGGVPVSHPALRFGLRLYENGYFWEAHEILEAIWKVAPQNSRDRLALRALIQLANAALKQKMGRRNAWSRLIAEVIGALAELSLRSDADVCGDTFAAQLDAEALAADLQARRGGFSLCPSLQPYFACEKVKAGSGRP
jgi:hypothetical protein